MSKSLYDKLSDMDLDFVLGWQESYYCVVINKKEYEIVVNDDEIIVNDYSDEEEKDITNTELGKAILEVFKESR